MIDHHCPLGSGDPATTLDTVISQLILPDSGGFVIIAWCSQPCIPCDWPWAFVDLPHSPAGYHYKHTQLVACIFNLTRREDLVAYLTEPFANPWLSLSRNSDITGLVELGYGCGVSVHLLVFEDYPMRSLMSALVLVEVGPWLITGAVDRYERLSTTDATSATLTGMRADTSYLSYMGWCPSTGRETGTLHPEPGFTSHVTTPW